jgi:hypothetical protein
MWQWVELVGRISHLLWFTFKFGIEPHLITVGTSMIAVFFAATAVFAVLGTVATVQLRRLESPFQCCSLLSVLMLEVMLVPDDASKPPWFARVAEKLLLMHSEDARKVLRP